MHDVFCLNMQHVSCLCESIRFVKNNTDIFIAFYIIELSFTKIKHIFVKYQNFSCFFCFAIYCQLSFSAIRIKKHLVSFAYLGNYLQIVPCHWHRAKKKYNRRMY